MADLRPTLAAGRPGRAVWQKKPIVRPPKPSAGYRGGLLMAGGQHGRRPCCRVRWAGTWRRVLTLIASKRRFGADIVGSTVSTSCNEANRAPQLPGAAPSARFTAAARRAWRRRSGPARTGPSVACVGSVTLLRVDHSVRGVLLFAEALQESRPSHLWLPAEARSICAPGSSTTQHRRCALRRASPSPPRTSCAPLASSSSNPSVSMRL